MASLSSSSQPSRQIWNDLATEVAEKLNRHGVGSPTLMATIERGVRYVDVFDPENMAVFGPKALVMGFIAVGRNDKDLVSYGNAASWFYDWLKLRIPEGQIASMIDGAVADPREIIARRKQKYPVVLSGEITSLLSLAASLSEFLNGRPTFQARHVFVAMVESGLLEYQLLKFFNFNFGNMLFDLKHDMIERMLDNPDKGETLAKWLHVFSLPTRDVDKFSTHAQSAGISNVRPARTATPYESVALGAIDAIGEFLASLQIQSVTPLVRSILDLAGRLDAPGDIDATRLLIACLGIGRKASDVEEALPLRALVELSRDARYAGMVSVEEDYHLASFLPPVIRATEHAKVVLTWAAQSAASWFEEDTTWLSARSVVAALLDRPMQLIEYFLVAT